MKKCLQYSKEVLDLVHMVDETNGAEIHVTDWNDFKQCIEYGLLQWVSGERGFGKQFKRINLTDLGKKVCQERKK